MSEPDFIPVDRLCHLTGYRLKTLYIAHSLGKGPLVPILTKLGGRLGAWRADYELWRDAQRKITACKASSKRW